jgi:hypothetical protein
LFSRSEPPTIALSVPLLLLLILVVIPVRSPCEKIAEPAFRPRAFSINRQPIEYLGTYR